MAVLCLPLAGPRRKKPEVAMNKTKNCLLFLPHKELCYLGFTAPRT